MTQLALQIALPVPLRRLFSYLPPENYSVEKLVPGLRVRVPFGKRILTGIFISTTETPDVAWEKLKPVAEVLDEESLFAADVWQLCHWAADYYHYSLGEVLSAALPGLLRKGKNPATAPLTRRASRVDLSHKGRGEMHELNSAQQTAVDAIQKSRGQFQPFLLDGVTGSGKTEVYLNAIEYFLKKDQQVLVLVPEIGLTPQTLQRFRDFFAEKIIAWHSSLTEKERYNAWIAAKTGDAKIMIGTRSAIFTPFKNLGLMIVDEEHDLSYKQQDSFRYHARDLAIMRAHMNHIPIVLGSATPSLESLHNAEQNRYQYLSLPKRAGKAAMPDVQILNICKKPLEQGLSPALLSEIKTHLNNGGQVMLFLNRRGFAPVLMCHECGWMAVCKRCDMRMTYHHHSSTLRCHHCDSQKKLMTHCEGCGEKSLHTIGLGTEQLEQVLANHFPDASVARIDRDSTQRKGSLEKLLDQIQNNEHQILIGTQMLAKGHHFPNVTLVAIIDADGGFFSPDFRALERMGQLLLQVSGRAGRAEKPGKVLIQTHHPDHPLLIQLLREGYKSFADSLLKERQIAFLPPYFFFALFRAEAYHARQAAGFLQQIKNITDVTGKNIRILGPIPALMPKRAGRHRVQLLIQAATRSVLQRFLKDLVPAIESLPGKHRVHWSLDVDPLEIY